MSNLEISEQLLTGESIPGLNFNPSYPLNSNIRVLSVTKDTKTFLSSEVDIPIGDRVNLCYASTIVTKGRGTGITIATGMHTQVCYVLRKQLVIRSGSHTLPQIGRIAAAINSGKTNTSGESVVDHRPWYQRVLNKILDFL